MSACLNDPSAPTTYAEHPTNSAMFFYSITTKPLRTQRRAGALLAKPATFFAIQPRMRIYP